MKFLSFLPMMMAFLSSPLVFAGTFSIENIHVHDQVGSLQEGIKVNKAFIPQVEVDVKISKDAPSKNIIARAYYFDSSGLLIQTFAEPSVAEHTATETERLRALKAAYIWPTILPKYQRISIYFPLPANLPSNWTLVVVFGNSKGAVAASVPDGQEQNLKYPEHDLVAKTVLSPDVEIDDPDQQVPLIEQIVQSNNPSYPTFTLLLHLPHGVTNPKDVSGVMATCIFADSVEEIRNQINAIQPQNDPNPYYAYAEAHKMAIIAWGARWIWKSYANFDELNKNEARAWDDNFQTLADAWDHGVGILVDKYGIPDHDYLMYGSCAGGEWVHRLALHKPDRFLAVQMNLSTSYDAPTPEASHIMWLLTTGELDWGCDRARRFYSAARGLGYPIIFKAIIGLGHSGSPLADQLGIRFFDYALAMKSKRDAANANDLTKSRPLDLSGFDASPFFGDLMNQEMFAVQDKEMIPPGFLVPLPTKDIADAWNK